MKRVLFLLPIILFSVVLAGVLFAFPAEGATINAPGVILGSGDDTPAAVPDGAAVLQEDAPLSVSGDAESAEKSEDGGTVSVVLTGEPEGDDGAARTKRKAMLSVTEDADLSTFGALAVNVRISPAEGITLPSGVLTVSLYTDGDILRFRSEILSGPVRTVVIDLTPLSERSSVRRITATFEWDNAGEDPGTVVFSRLFGIADGKLPNAAMSSLSLSAGAGTMTLKNGVLSISPAGGKAELYAAADPAALPETEVSGEEIPVRYAALTLVSNGGYVSADLGKGTERVRAGSPSSQTRRIFPGEHVYLFRFVSNEVGTVKFTFQSPDGSPVTCKSLEYFVTGTHDPTVDSAGCEIDFTVRDGVLSAEGKLKKSAAVELVGKTLGLFTAPAVGGDAVMLAEGRAGSAFSFSVPLSSLPREGRENYFWVSVLEEDGSVPITEKQFLPGAEPSEGNASVTGLYGAEPAGVFEAGMNRAVVDVELDRLTGGGRTLATGLAAIRDSETYYLNDEYVRGLDAEMEFYEASGIGVYLRFTVGDVSKWFGKDAAKDGDDPRGLGLYLALTSFFCGRYDNVSSIVIPDLKGDGPLWEDACCAALLARLTYAAASEYNGSFTVTVPVAGLGGGEDGEIFAAFVAESLYQIGQIPWSLLTVTGESSFDGLDAAVTSSRANGTASPSFSALLLTPEGKTAPDAARIFLDLCAKGREAGSRAVILSVPSVSGSGLLDYSILRESGAGGGARDTVGFSEVEPLVRSSAVLWDFRESYSTGGWVAGSGIGSFGTAFYAGRSGERVLRATLDAESSHGIILRSFADEINFSRFPLVEFDLAVSSETGAVVTFMFGTDGGNVEYVLDCPDNAGERRVVCDLGDLPGTGGIKWVSVLIRSEGTATADVFGITAHGRTEAEGSLPIDGQPQDGKGPEKEFDKRIVYAPVAAGIVLIPLAIYLFRSDRDESFARARSRRERDK